MKNNWVTWPSLLATAGVVAVLTTGCGGDDSSSDQATASSGDNSAQTSNASGVKDAQAAVDKAYNGTFREPPSTGPGAQKGKNVWAIACIASAPGCQTPTKAVAEAGKSLGWKVTMADGKANPATYVSTIKQALAAGADGIVTTSLDCSAAKAGLEAAKAKNVPVVGVYSFDCDDPSVGGQALFSTADIYGSTPAEYFTTWGTLTADYIIAKTNGKAKIVEITGPGYLNSSYKDKGLRDELKAKCPDCEIVAEVKSPSTDNASGLAVQKVKTALQQHPEANVLSTYSDTKALLLGQTIKALNKKDFLMVGGEGNVENMDLIRDGAQAVSVGVPAEWLGWAGADTLNRIFAGEDKPVDEGLGFSIIDKDHNLPSAAGTLWQPQIDFKSAYKKVWAGSGS